MQPRERAAKLCEPIRRYLPEDIFTMFVDDIADGIYYAMLAERDICLTAIHQWKDNPDNYDTGWNAEDAAWSIESAILKVKHDPRA